METNLFNPVLAQAAVLPASDQPFPSSLQPLPPDPLPPLRYFLLGPPATRPCDLPLPHPLPNSEPVEGIPAALGEVVPDRIERKQEAGQLDGRPEGIRAVHLHSPSAHVMDEPSDECAALQVVPYIV